VTLGSCPPVIPQDQLAEINDTIAFLGYFYDVILDDLDRKGEAVIALTHSPAFSCRVRPLGSGKYVILVPLGMPARARVLVRLLLRYWGRESRILVTQSSLDNLPGGGKAVPKLLHPIFSDDQDFENYWEAIYELDNVVEADQRTESDVRELVHLSLVYLISHEFTHVLHGHFDMPQRPRSENIGLSQDEILRGLELDADDGATAMAMKVIQEGVELHTSAGRQEDITLGWLRLSYVATMLFGIFDAQRKYLGAYDEGQYNHPLVRREIFSGAILRCLDAPEPIRDILRQCENEGWQRCVFAFNDLTLDAMQGVFGDYPEGYISAPLQSLLYGRSGAAKRVESDLIREASTLLYRVRRLLPIFRTTER